jgi:hypothetical protein
VVVRPELRAPEEWWKTADDRTRYDLLKGLFVEKHLTVIRAEQKSCGVCGGTGQDAAGTLCASCQGLKGYRVLIYR